MTTSIRSDALGYESRRANQMQKQVFKNRKQGCRVTGFGGQDIGLTESTQTFLIIRYSNKNL